MSFRGNLLDFRETIITNPLRIFEICHHGSFGGTIRAKYLTTVSTMMFSSGDIKSVLAALAGINLSIVRPFSAGLFRQFHLNGLVFAPQFV